MDRTARRWVVAGACVGWLGVGIYGLWEIYRSETDDWERPYMLYTMALALASTLTLVTAWAASCKTDRTGWRRWGIGFAVLAALSTVMAWALPLWMTLIAISVMTLAVAAPPERRARVASLGAAQLIGLAAMWIAIEAEVGSPDSYGDYPAAFGIGLVVTAILSVAALIYLARPAAAAGGVPSSTAVDPMTPAAR